MSDNNDLGPKEKALIEAIILEILKLEQSGTVPVAKPKA